MKNCILAICLLTTCLLIAAPASADTITSGALRIDEYGLATLQLATDDGFAFDGYINLSDGISHPIDPDAGAANLGGRWLGSAVWGAGTRDGVGADVGYMDSDNQADLSLYASAAWEAFEVEALVTTGFSMRGVFRFLAETIDVEGNGLATLFMRREADGSFLRTVAYEFDSGDPNPEPTTLLLIGAGLAVMARRRWLTNRGQL